MDQISSDHLDQVSFCKMIRSVLALNFGKSFPTILRSVYLSNILTPLCTTTTAVVDSGASIFDQFRSVQPDQFRSVSDQIRSVRSDQFSPLIWLISAW